MPNQDILLIKFISKVLLSYLNDKNSFLQWQVHIIFFLIASIILKENLYKL